MTGDDAVWSLADAPEPVLADDALQGTPGSPGLTAGPAHVVRSPWTALFARAAGIVAESGGPLSQGATAAREHGIPAVMAVCGATQLLANGQTLLVDSGRGTIRLQ